MMNNEAMAKIPLSTGSSPMLFHIPPGFGMLKDYEMSLKRRIKNHPDRPPRRKPGDGYTIVGALAGLVIGGIVGLYTDNIWFFIVLIIGGGIGGAYLAPYLRSLVKKLKQPKDKDKEPEGPIK